MGQGNPVLLCAGREMTDPHFPVSEASVQGKRLIMLDHLGLLPVISSVCGGVEGKAQGCAWALRHSMTRAQFTGLFVSLFPTQRN